MIPCPYFYYFGIECLGCGLQRSVVSLFNCDFFKSFQFYPGLIPLFIYLILEFLRIIRVRWAGQNDAIKIFGMGTFIIQTINYSLRVFGLIPWACEIN